MSSRVKGRRRRAIKLGVIALTGTLIMVASACSSTASSTAGAGGGSAGSGSAGTGGSTAASTQTKFPYTFHNPDGSTTVVNAEPKRWVLIGATELDVFLAIGAKPVAMATFAAPKAQVTVADADAELTPAEIKGITGVGAFYTPDFEKIASLSPDLIIVQSDFPATEIKQLKQIAPTIELTDSTPTPLADEYFWQTSLLAVAPIFNATDRAKQIIARLDQRENALSGFAKGTTVAQLLPYSGTSYALVNSDQDLGSVLQLAGATIEKSIKNGKASGEYFTDFTDESLPFLTAQKVLLDAGGQPTINQVKQDPLYSKIPAYATHQVYFTQWFALGPPGTSDELEQLGTLMFGATGLEATMTGDSASQTGVADLDVGDNGQRACWDISTSGIGTPKSAEVVDASGKTLFSLGNYSAEGCQTITAAEGQALLAAPGNYQVRIDTASATGVLKGGLGLDTPGFFLPGNQTITEPSSVG